MIDSVVNYGIIGAGENNWPEDYNFGEQFHFSVTPDADSGQVLLKLFITSSTAPDTMYDVILELDIIGGSAGPITSVVIQVMD